MAPTIGRVALDNGFHGSIPGDWVAPPPQNIQKAAEAEFERFKQAWSQYPGAIDVWVRNWQHVAQLFDYGSAVRKILYTTNAVESVNSSLRKVTKKGAFPNENALFKLLYLRITELYKKWNGRPLNNWALVRNQLDMDEKIQERIRKYENGGF